MDKEIRSYINILLDSVIDIKQRVEKLEEDATTRDDVISEQIEGLYDHIDNLEYSLNDMSSDIESLIDGYEEEGEEYNFFDELYKAGAKTTRELIDEDDFSFIIDHEGVDGDEITMTTDQLRDALQKSFDNGKASGDIDIDNLYEDDDVLITKSDAMGSTTFAITTSN